MADDRVKPVAESALSPRESPGRRLFPLLFGLLLAISLLKFGNPPIMEQWVSPPTDIYEFIFAGPWPITWAYALTATVLLCALINFKLTKPSFVAVIPGIWLIWQLLASWTSVDAGLSALTTKHFIVCICCFYLGYYALSRPNKLTVFWGCLVVGFIVVLASGWQQHFGGLEATRKYFFEQIYPTLKVVPPDYLKKMNSTRIFSTLFYPNSLAGAIILLLPSILLVLWQLRSKFTLGARAFLVSVILIGALACLFWSGSKAGWLIMLSLGLVFVLKLPFSRGWKIGLVVFLLMAGLGGFFAKYLGFFEKGATSVSARFDYWRVALKIAKTNPLLGTGPGTFAIPYAKLKDPHSEMTRLTHNDYLEQATDSGIPGFLLYSSFIMASLYTCFPRGGIRFKDDALGPPQNDERQVHFAMWLGLLGFSLQSLVEFNLYVPALAWLAFSFNGFLLGRKLRLKSSYPGF